jgi:ribosome-associated protein
MMTGRDTPPVDPAASASLEAGDAASADELVIDGRVRIPLRELAYRFSRGGGPGGQNVNKVETSVELLFDLARTPSLADAERELAMQRLASHLDSRGVLRLVSRSERSQLANREDVTRRFVELLARALIPPKRRRRTRPSRAAKARRVADKRRAGQVKRDRRISYGDDP